MSFILKALKKLEEEKAAQRIRPQDIQSAILTGEGAAPSNSRRYVKPMAILLVLIAGSCLTYLVLRQSPAPSARMQHRTAEKEPRDAQPLQSQVTAPSPAAMPAPPERSAAAEKALTEPGPAPPASGEKAPANPPPAYRPAGTSLSPREGQSGPETSGAAPAGLKVNGIAFQDDPSQSVAVIDGKLVRRGMTIQGMRVEEILPDRVKFSGNGGAVEVKMTK